MTIDPRTQLGADQADCAAHACPVKGLSRLTSSPRILTDPKFAAVFGCGRARLRPSPKHAARLTDHAWCAALSVCTSHASTVSFGTDTQTNMTRLVRDERGAILMMAVFMSAMLLGLLYYISGVGQTILYRERSQNSADSIAFSASVLKAQSMNTLAMLNVFMSGVAAPIAMSRSIREITFPQAYDACVSATRDEERCQRYWGDKRQEADGRVRQVEIPAGRLLRDARRIGNYLVDHASEISGEYAQQLMRAKPTDSIDTGFVAPTTERLPVRNADTHLCERRLRTPASEYGRPTALDFDGNRYYKNIAEGAYAFELNSELPRLCNNDLTLYQLEDDANMGGEDYQVRSGVLGTPPFDSYREGMTLARWSRDTPTGSVARQRLETFSRLGTAQSEFYFDGEGRLELEELLWEARWLARLRRFRLDNNTPVELNRACNQSAAGQCGVLLQIDDIAGIMVH